MMKLIYSHPQTGVKVAGVRLGPGATIKAGDEYASSDGQWRVTESFLNTVIAKGCVTVWIRTTGITDWARILLEELILHDHYLMPYDNSRWMRIPQPGVTPDDRVSWPVNPEAPEELRSAGLITLMSHHRPPVFEVSDAGKELLIVK